MSFDSKSPIKIVRTKNRLDRGNRDILMNIMYQD